MGGGLDLSGSQYPALSAAGPDTRRSIRRSVGPQSTSDPARTLRRPPRSSPPPQPKRGTVHPPAYLPRMAGRYRNESAVLQLTMGDTTWEMSQKTDSQA